MDNSNNGFKAIVEIYPTRSTVEIVDDTYNTRVFRRFETESQAMAFLEMMKDEIRIVRTIINRN